MLRISIPRRFAFTGLLLLVMAIIATVFASTIGAGSSAYAGRQIRNQSFQPKTFQQMVQAHQLPPTVQVLPSQPPTSTLPLSPLPRALTTPFQKPPRAQP